MGIRRLTQDLQQFSEPAVLDGNADNLILNDGELRISRIVVDGPSLVYHVYFGMLGQMSVAELSAGLVPTYTTVIKGVRSLITELKGRGVEIEAMLFDGDLPTSKREVRLERMEKSRQQLASFRASHPELSPLSAPKELSAVNAWNAEAKPFLNAQKALPQLPFLAPCITEAITSYSGIVEVQVVPEEADFACARVAQTSGAAILTNDSDLSLYELGPEGCVLWLRDLALTKIADPSASKLVCSCFRPPRTAQRLRLPCFLHFGFERFMDADATASTIQERAKTSVSQSPRQKQFQAFRMGFELASQPIQPIDLTGLDTRVCEFVNQAFSSNDPPHVYLSILHEDPSRDSSWMYGFTFRQLAYSLFYHILNKRPPGPVMEYARKGSLIAGTALSILSKEQMYAIVTTLIEKLTSIPARDTPAWYAAAIIVVLQHKIDAKKAPVTHAMVDKLFGLNAESESSLSWDDIHLLGNAHAVLYSWRMLKQILSWAHKHCDAEDMRRDVLDGVEKLMMCFDDMPTISELFLQTGEMKSLSRQQRGRGTAVVKDVLDAYVEVSEEKQMQRVGKRKRRKESGEVLRGMLGRNAFAALADGTSHEDD